MTNRTAAPTNINSRQDILQAYVWWDCVAAGFGGSYYNYRMTDMSLISYGGSTYYASAAKETGPWNQTGVVKCK